MTTADTEAMTALQELLDERQRYQGWLTALEERRASTPAHVYDRVSTDYSLRLDRVMQRLTERAGQLRATTDSIITRIGALRTHESERADERAEWELRASVGELSPDEWERRRADADREIEAIVQERQGLETELTEIERIVAMTTAPAPVQPAPEPDASAGAAAPTPVQDATPAPATVPVAPSISDFITDRGPAQRAAATATAAPQGDGAPAAPEVGHAAAAAAPAPAPAPATPPAPAPSGGNPFGKLDKLAVSGRADHEGAALETRKDTDKTLRCPECGAMNYATEWYCERCGGELSTF